MSQGKHLFISRRGDLLPRWAETFPSALAMKTDEFHQNIPCDIVWLRIVSGEQVAEQLDFVRRKPGAGKCVVLSDQPDDEEALAAFAAAARGYCNTHATPAVLQQVADVVLQGGLWIGESLMQRLLAATARLLPPQDMAASAAWSKSLTGREREITLMVSSGASNKEVARQFGITERTVKAHVGSVLDKLKVRDRLQLALLVNSRRPS